MGWLPGTRFSLEPLWVRHDYDTSSYESRMTSYMYKCIRVRRDLPTSFSQLLC